MNWTEWLLILSVIIDIIISGVLMWVRYYTSEEIREDYETMEGAFRDLYTRNAEMRDQITKLNDENHNLWYRLNEYGEHIMELKGLRDKRPVTEQLSDTQRIAPFDRSSKAYGPCGQEGHPDIPHFCTYLE